MHMICFTVSMPPTRRFSQPECDIKPLQPKPELQPPGRMKKRKYITQFCRGHAILVWCCLLCSCSLLSAWFCTPLVSKLKICKAIIDIVLKFCIGLNS